MTLVVIYLALNSPGSARNYFILSDCSRIVVFKCGGRVSSTVFDISEMSLSSERASQSERDMHLMVFLKCVRIYLLGPYYRIKLQLF